MGGSTVLYEYDEDLIVNWRTEEDRRRRHCVSRIYYISWALTLMPSTGSVKQIQNIHWFAFKAGKIPRAINVIVAITWSRSSHFRPHCGTCLCSNYWDQIPRTCHVFTRLFTSNTPCYFLDFSCRILCSSRVRRKGILKFASFVGLYIFSVEFGLSRRQQNESTDWNVCRVVASMLNLWSIFHSFLTLIFHLHIRVSTLKENIQRHTLRYPICRRGLYAE